MVALFEKMSAIELAKYIVTKCARDGCPISNLQLQGILYCIQKDYLNKDELAFSDDIEAWQFGPAVREVYYWFCGFGAMPITATYHVDIPFDDIEKIDPIIETERVKKPWDSAKETHKQDGAWALTYGNDLGNRSVIPVELIKAAG